MNRLRIISFLFLCLGCGLLSSCLEDIDLDTGEQILYVYCILGQGPEQELELSYCAPTGGTSSPVGEGVVISLYDNGAPVGDFTRVSETKWNLDFSPEGGHTYRLEVTVPGEEQLTAETTFPTVSVLQEVWYPTDIEYPAGQVSTGYYKLFELNADEDQILWCFFENPEDGKKAFSDYVVTDHPGVDPPERQVILGILIPRPGVIFMSISGVWRFTSRGVVSFVVRMILPLHSFTKESSGSCTRAVLSGRRNVSQSTALTIMGLFPWRKGMPEDSVWLA